MAGKNTVFLTIVIHWYEMLNPLVFILKKKKAIPKNIRNMISMSHYKRNKNNKLQNLITL